MAISPRHAAAREWVAAGIPVFPCLPGRKAPAVAGGFHAATTDLEQIDRWWGDADYNVGCEPDRAGWAVVDVDHPGASDGGSEAFPATYRVRTPRGGYHLYFAGSVATTAGKLGPGIDTRGAGGYVLVPPSVVDGKEYVVEDDRDPAPLPAGITERLAQRSPVVERPADELDTEASVSAARTRLAQYVAEGRVAIEGSGGNDFTYRVAAELGDLGVSEDVCLDLMAGEWNEACQPPWEEDDLAAIVASAYEHRQNAVGAYAVAPASETFADIGELDGTGQGAVRPAAKSRFKIERGRALIPGPEPAWLFPGLIPERANCLLLAPAKTGGKSWVLTSLACAAATGRTWGRLGPIRCGPVIYAAGEKRHELKRRIAAWCLVNNVDMAEMGNLLLMPPPMIAMAGEAEEWWQAVNDELGGDKPALVIFDTAARVMIGMDENSAKDVGLFSRFVQRTGEQWDCATLSSHHASDKQGGGAYRGSSAFMGNFDTILQSEYTRATKALLLRVKEHSDHEVTDRSVWTFEGQEIAGSLAFSPTTYKEHKALADKGDPYGHEQVYAALVSMGAYGEGVTSEVLARELCKGEAGDQTPEEHEDLIARFTRGLAAHAKTQLRGFTEGHGAKLRWLLQAPGQAN